MEGIAEQLEQEDRRPPRQVPNAAPRKSVTRRDAAHLKTIAPKCARRIGPAEGCSGKLIDRGLAFPASAI